MRRLFLVLYFCTGIPAATAGAAQLGFGAAPAALCRIAVGVAEGASGLPAGLMAAIATVESGRRDPNTGEMRPWPWTADIEGVGSFYETKAAAIAAVRQAQLQGARSIDIGCMQVNIQQHPDAFASLEQAFDPTANAAFAARFLRDLHAQSGDWGKAAALYHSATPSLGADYQRKVMAAWNGTRQELAAAPVGRAWAASLGGSSPFGVSGGVAGLGSFRSPVARMTALPGAAGGVTGRTLAAYRAMPVTLGARAAFGLRR